MTGGAFILAADTAVGRRPAHPAQGRNARGRSGLPGLLSGRSHRVFTGLCLITPKGRRITKVVDTKVRFKRLSREDIESYLVSDEWRGKAGGYAVQGRAEIFVRHINGSFSNIVGLPLYETIGALQGAGFPVYYSWMNAQPQ